MRSLSVKYVEQNAVVSNTFAGYVDEHNATEISFTLPSDITSNGNVSKYAVLIHSGDKIILYDKYFNKGENVKISLHRCFTQNELLAIQIEAYSADGSLVAKTPIAKFKLLKSIANEKSTVSDVSDDESILSQIIENSMSRHTHSNVDVLDKLTDSNNELYYNGVNISSKIESISSEKVTYQYEYEGTVISEVKSALDKLFSNISNAYIEATQSDDGATIKIVDKDGVSSTVFLSNGKDGKTPERGTDYWTEDDIKIIQEYIDGQAIEGKSAYDIAIKNGFIGTELEWLATLAGTDGATFTPSVSSEGVLSWENDKGLSNPDPINIKGGKGDSPVKGVDYWTEDDIAEIKSYVDTQILGGSS